MPTLVKISDLASQPALTSSALLEVEQGGISYKATVQQLLNLALTGDSGSSGGSSGSAGVTTGPMTIGALTFSARSHGRLFDVDASYRLALSAPTQDRPTNPTYGGIGLISKVTDGVAAGTSNQHTYILDATFVGGRAYVVDADGFYRVSQVQPQAVLDNSYGQAALVSSNDGMTGIAVLASTAYTMHWDWNGSGVDYTYTIKELKTTADMTSHVSVATGSLPDQGYVLASNGTNLFYFGSGSNVYSVGLSNSPAQTLLFTAASTVAEIKFYNGLLYITDYSNTLWIVNASTGALVTSHANMRVAITRAAPIYGGSRFAFPTVCVLPALNKVLALRQTNRTQVSTPTQVEYRASATTSVLNLNPTTGAIDATTTFNTSTSDLLIPWGILNVIDGKLYIATGATHDPDYSGASNVNVTVRQLVAPISFP